MEFRPAQESELDAVFALYQSVLGSEFCIWDAEYPSRRGVWEDFETGNLYVLAGESGLLGALSVEQESEMDNLSFWQVTGVPWREIARVVVDPAKRGHGYAGYMVEQIQPILQEQGVGAIRLAVGPDHLPARRTYEKAGFRMAGRAYIFGHDYCLMEKALF